MGITELAELIRAGLDADEALALEAPGRRWHIGNAVDPTQPCNVHTFPEARGVADGLNWLVAEHIARHNPQRVLAEVAAKRQLLAIVREWPHQDWCDLLHDPNNEATCDPDCGRDKRVHAVLQALATPYQEADHG